MRAIDGWYTWTQRRFRRMRIRYNAEVRLEKHADRQRGLGGGYCRWDELTDHKGCFPQPEFATPARRAE